MVLFRGCVVFSLVSSTPSSLLVNPILKYYLISIHIFFTFWIFTLWLVFYNIMTCTCWSLTTSVVFGVLGGIISPLVAIAVFCPHCAWQVCVYNTLLKCHQLSSCSFHFVWVRYNEQWSTISKLILVCMLSNWRKKKH